MQSDSRRDLFTSLVGTVPLADVLADLPLPTPLPTPLEQTVLGTKDLSQESKKLLDSTNSALCSRIAQALLAVDTSFLDLKDVAQTVPYTPSMKDPPLIRSVMANLMPQALVKVQKLDPDLYRGPSTGNTAVPCPPPPSIPVVPDLQTDAVVPVHAVPDPVILKPPPGRKKEKDKRKSSLQAAAAADIPRVPRSVEPKSRKSRRISSSSDESPPRKKRPKLGEQHPSPTTDSFRVSIGRPSTQPAPREQELPPPKQQQTKKRQKAKPAKISQQAPPKASFSGPQRPLVVHIPRAKLRGPCGLPYAGEVQVLQSGEALGPVSGGDMVTVPMADEGWVQQQQDFSMAPGVTDRELPKEHKKKKKKHSRHHGDHAKVANLKRFTAMVCSLFDQQLSEEDLFNRITMSEILSQVTNLKQQGCLHEIPVDSLLQLIGLMDKHVLDSANLLINTAPEGMEGDTKAWREVARDRILRSADAALVILHIITAPDMPKKVHLEESVDQVLSLTKFHLDNNIYPQFDPVYKAEKKDSGMLPRQKRRAGGSSQTAANKVVNAVYHKLAEVVDTMAVLTETQPLTDTTVLLLSSMGTLPFFVENVALLQLSALRLVRAIFTRYEKHRDLILEEVFASLRRLPTTKRNLRSYKLSNGQHIQMLTALVLQLVQCTVVPPKPPSQDQLQKSSTPESTKEEMDKKPDMDVQLTNTYNQALATGKNFLAKFLKKCSGGKDEDDFRPLFDNFVQDLLTTLNLPMWPASEVLLTLLGILLVQSFSNRSTEQSVRLMSLEHLGVIAARLRKDVTTPTSEAENDELVDVMAQVKVSKLDSATPSPTALAPMDPLSENNQHLQKALIAYLNRQSESDPASAFARDFYIGQWLYDIHIELERVLKENPTSPTLNFEPYSGALEGVEGGISSSGIALQQSELKKSLILSFLDSRKMSSFKQLESALDERLAVLVTRQLASSRALTKSFDMYLQKLIVVSNEPAVHVRTRAMKALSSIVAADPGILSRLDMKQAVGFRLSDTSTLVREAAVDLIGRFVLSRPDLTDKYYDMIAERIRDSGVSVRKRVIKIMKDICVMQPDFPKINDICVRIIRRISDEEGIKQLVSSVFSELWFSPLPDGPHQKELLLRRVTNITAVVEICKEYEWFEQLLEQILKGEDQAAKQAVLNVCQLMVDCLVENVLSLDESSAKGSSSLMPCIITLYLFCNVKPALLLNHATTLHPYLSSVCAAQNDVMVLHFVAKILKEVVPLMQHPSQTFLAGLEEDLVKLIMKQGQFLIHSAVECLSAVINNVSHNYNLVKDCFQRFFRCMEHMRSKQVNDPQFKSLRISLLRSVFTVGVLCKFFDFDAIIPAPTGSEAMSRRVYSNLIHFFKTGDEELQVKTVKGLGLFCIRYPDMMLHADMRQLINDWLTKECVSTKKIEVLRNLHSYFKEVEMKLKAADTNWDKEGADTDNLQEFGDQHSNISSNVAQAFLMPVLESFFHIELQVRLAALQAVLLILRQGLVHPAQCVPYLMAMSTDPDQTIKVKADQHLTEHTSRYGHLMQTQLLGGVRKSYEFQRLIAGDGARGYSNDSVGNSASLLSHIYLLARSNKQHRRVLLRALLRHFEDYEKNSLGLLLYLADTLAYLPYNTMEEPLFVIHHVDMTISIVGSNLLQQFKEVIGRGTTRATEEVEISDLTENSYDLQQLSDCCCSCQGCFLLLLLKQHLKKSFGLSDTKCQKYSPTESNKANDKVTNRKVGLLFDPQQVVALVKQEAISARRLLLSRDECVKYYEEFKQLMDQLDPFEGDDDGSDQEAPPTVAPSVPEAVQQPPQPEKEGDVPAIVPPAPPPPAHTLSARRSSRASSTSSISSRRGKKSTAKQKKKKRKIILSSGSSEEEDGSGWT